MKGFSSLYSIFSFIFSFYLLMGVHNIHIMNLCDTQHGLAALAFFFFFLFLFLLSFNHHIIIMIQSRIYHSVLLSILLFFFFCEYPSFFAYSLFKYSFLISIWTYSD